MNRVPLADLRLLRHALGLANSGRGTPYRRHFVTGAGSDDHAGCMRLVAAGLMVKRPPTALTGGDDLFLVTEAGEREARS